MLKFPKPMKQTLKILFYFLLFFCIACQNEPTANETTVTHIASDNQITWTTNGVRFSPPQVRGFLFQKNNYYQLDMSAMEGSAGLLLILVTDNENLKGRYSIEQVDKDGIPFSKTGVKMNTLENGMLSVYISEDCKSIEGFIAIEEYDKINQTISGQFEVNLCTNGRFGKVDNKMLTNGQFEKIALNTPNTQ